MTPEERRAQVERALIEAIKEVLTIGPSLPPGPYRPLSERIATAILDRVELMVNEARTDTAREIFGTMELEKCDPSVGPWFDPYYSLPAEALDTLKAKYGVEGK